jgi:hypothetical protein
MTLRDSSRRRLVFALAGGAAIAAALVAPALGVLGGGGGAPVIGKADARQVGAAVRADGRRVGLYQAPATNRGRCIAIHVGAIPSRGLGNGGVVCQRGGAQQQAQPIVAFVNWALEGGSYAVTVAGRVTPNIQRLELVRGGAPEPLMLRDGYFVTALANVGASGAVSDTDVSHALVAYDAVGNQVARLDLQKMVDQATPPK